MTQDEQNHSSDQNEIQIEKQQKEDNAEKQDEVSRGRDWRKIVVGFVFIFLVVVIWYVISFFIP